MTDCICPHCGADLADTPLPVDRMSWYGGTDGVERICEGCHRPAHASRLIGIYDRGSDRTVSWLCPDCRTTWPR